MRHFAEIDDNNIVLRVIIVESGDYAHELLGGNWVETFKDDINKNYASYNSIYVPKLENFYSPQPKINSILDMKDLKWKSQPKIYHNLFFGNKPTIIITEKNEIYRWNENINDWDEV
jgi:nicotinamide mononucleotide adenylyltransferase